MAHELVSDRDRPMRLVALKLADRSTVNIWIIGNTWGFVSDSRGRWVATTLIAGNRYDNLDGVASEWDYVLSSGRPRHWSRVSHLYAALAAYCVAEGIIIQVGGSW